MYIWFIHCGKAIFQCRMKGITGFSTWIFIPLNEMNIKYPQKSPSAL
jgi:hypothetical protein